MKLNVKTLYRINLKGVLPEKDSLVPDSIEVMIEQFWAMMGSCYRG